MKWLALIGMLLSATYPRNSYADTSPSQPPACDPQDSACLLDQSLYQAFRANLAENKLQGCQNDLQRTEEELQKANSGPSKVQVLVIGGMVFVIFLGSVQTVFKLLAK